MDNKQYFEQQEKNVREIAAYLGCNADELWSETERLLHDSYRKGWKDAGGIVNGMLNV